MFIFPTIDLVATGKNIVRLREESGLSVRELQDIFGFATPQAIYKWQHGSTMPTIDNLIVLSAVFKVSLDEIIILEANKKISA
ncbi:helix-turn-helix domain-containing protein [Lachnoanaerobaculum umeaense]|jgi:predicted transcriptional regulators|uniref:XRE family transcriptional regulator n=1 Tax=Lachnoanaerobaculum umeaense TaxID=617123 RepID=A0A385PY61_9FIRM|nr:helix-turn-helix transcriptional regulator [Lachnoanaerobaculum umeaense]AYA98865.1 XRE family transcriptional regulator [Lachnoanaerobaculum umeaense]PZW94917.1 DNA-binding XRE family transcriptional regulator [Lachnoanaerobaculum umeaense]